MNVDLSLHKEKMECADTCCRYTSQENIECTSIDRVVINVGGTRHECYIGTITNFPDTRLYWIAETALKMADFDPDKNEFFFDRHPGCFQNILNYCRTGKLHCPTDVCGPLFEEELQFWGIDELMMEPCCWENYTQHREASKKLRMFDELYKEEIGVNEKEKRGQEVLKSKSRTMLFVNNIINKAWILLEKPQMNRTAQVIAFLTIAVTLLSVTTFCLETMRDFRKHENIFYRFEIFYCAFFTADFFLRLVCCPSKKEFIKDPMTWIDFLSTIQFYIGYLSSSSMFNFLFMLRLVRICRLLRFFRKLSGMIVIGQTLISSAQELLLLGLILFVPMVIFSTMVYYAEGGKNDGKFESIPGSFWWAIITMTTVGYGDVYPETVYGKVIGSACAMSGCLVVALPISVIGSNFSFYYSYAQARMRLPKREHQVLLAADKVLVRTDTVQSSSTWSFDDEETDDMSEEVPNRYRRHAIRSSIGPIKFLNKDSNGKTKSNATNSLLQTQPCIKCPLLNEEASFEVHNKKKTAENAVHVTLTDIDVSDVKTKVDDEILVERKCRSRSSHTNGSNRDTSNVIRSTQSHEALLDILRSGPARKRLLHLDISQYTPLKVSAADHTVRQKTKNNPFQGIVCHHANNNDVVHHEQSRERSNTESKMRKISLITHRERSNSDRKISVMKEPQRKRNLVVLVEDNVSLYSDNEQSQPSKNDSSL